MFEYQKLVHKTKKKSVRILALFTHFLWYCVENSRILWYNKLNQSANKKIDLRGLLWQALKSIWILF